MYSKNLMKKCIFILMIVLILSVLVSCSSPYKNSKYITLSKYMGVEVDYEEIKVTQDDLDREIAIFLDSYAEVVVFEDGIVQEKDIVNIDYSGTIDGKPFENGAHTDYDLEIGSNTFIDDFEDKLIGTQIGQTTEITAEFPTNFRDNNGDISDLAGKEAVFVVTVNKVTRRVPPEYTDEFLNSLNIGYKTVREHNQFLQQEILRYNKIQTVWNIIVDSTEVKKYPNTVEKRVAMVREYYEYYMAYYGYTSFNEFCIDSLGQTEEEFNQTNLLSAQEGVKQEMISQAIAQLEDINLTNKEIQDGYDNYAEYYGYDNTEDFLKEYDKESLQSSILLNKIMEYVAQHAIIINSP